MPDINITDCSEALAAIECYRRLKKDLKQDITPRLIGWGVAAIAIESPRLLIGRGWDKKTTEERWRLVRMNLSATAINALAARLKQQYGPPPDQLSLFEGKPGEQ